MILLYGAGGEPGGGEDLLEIVKEAGMLQNKPVTLKLCLQNNQKPRLGQRIAPSRGFPTETGFGKQ